MNEPSFAAEKVVAEIDEEVEKINKWIATDNSGNFQGAMAPAISQLTGFAQKLRQKHSVTERHKWNVYDTAKLADLGWQYARDYFLYSKYVHATISGVISQEFLIGRGYILQTTIFVILCAIGNTVQGIETENPQRAIDETTRLMSVLMAMIKEGAFRDCPDK